MSEEGQGSAYNPADLINYAMDKPIGAARAALRIALSDTDVDAEVLIEDLKDNMELNQERLKMVAGALRSNPDSLLSKMPGDIKRRQLADAFGV